MKKILKKSVLAAVVICLSAFLLIGCQSNKNLVATVNGTDITEEQLQEQGEIVASFGQTLSWKYLCWVREHPLHWHGRTQVLYGARGALASRTMIERFRQESGAHLTIMEGGEHWFHTPVQMAVLQTWEETNF